jgi:Transcriptional Coactivator p15 (PC4)
MANLERPTPQHNEPDCIIGTTRKNAQEDIALSLRTYKGYRFIDVRVRARRSDGELVPTTKGVAIKPDALPKIIELLRQAHLAAVEAGWCSANDA